MLGNTSLSHIILKLLLYFSPFILIAFFVIPVLYISNELMPVDDVIKNQLSNNKAYLYGLAYSNQDAYYKKELLIQSKPTVLALGTSRVMQFRSYFFAKDAKFTNAGGGIANIYQFIPFFENISSAVKPDIIIIGLDQYFFNDNWNDNNRFDPKSYKRSLNNIPTATSIITDSSYALFKDILKRKVKLKQLASFSGEQKVGMSAIMNSDGFRNDGSYRYGSRVTSPQKLDDYQFRDTFNRIKCGNNRFEYGSYVSKSAVNELDSILSYCKKKNIYVIGFLPPFAPSVVDRMKKEGVKYKYLWQINPIVTPIFERYKYKFFDFTDMTEFGSTDREFIDGFHGSDITYAKIFVSMSKSVSLLNKYSNLSQLEFLMSHPVNDIMIVDDNF